MKKIMVTIFIIVLCAASIWATKKFIVPIKPFTDEDRTAARSVGNPKAPIWIVEYFDYQCAPCQRASALVEEMIIKYPNKIYFQTRFYPLQNHKYAVSAALHAECASEQGKFWEYHKLLFSNQLAWSQAPPYEVNSLFLKYAAEVGLDTKRIELCVASEKTAEKIKKEVENAKSMGVESTPTFYINGQMVVGIQALEEALANLAPQMTQQ